MAEIRMPKLSDTMEEGTILAWVKAEGEEVHCGEIVVQVASDKASFELQAETDGTLHQLVERGSSHRVGTKIAQVVGPGEVSFDSPAGYADSGRPPTRPSAGEGRVAAEGLGATAPELSRVSPLARTLGRELGVDVERLTGSGPGGMVVREQVLTAKREQPADGSCGGVRRRPTKMEFAIARRMVAATSQVPHFYLGADVRMEEALQAITELRRRSGDSPRVTLSHLLLKATALALGRHPAIARSWLGDSFYLHSEVNIALAVALRGGLVAPVVRRVDQKSVVTIAEESGQLVRRARRDALRESELTGAILTISNLGMYGVDEFSAILSPPQAATLAVGAVQARPVVEDGQLKIGQVARLNLSCDHRVIYGAAAASFLGELQGLLEKSREWALV